MLERFARLRRRWLLIFLDVAVLAAALALSYELRFEFKLTASLRRLLLLQLPVVVLVQLSTLRLFRVHAFMWRYIGMAEVAPFIRAAGASLVALVALRYGLPNALVAFGPPLSVACSTTAFGIGGVLAARVLVRAWFERREREGKRLAKKAPSPPPRTLLVGAGQAGILAARELAREPHPTLDVAGFVDDDPAKANAIVHGVRVLGKLDDLPRLVREHAVEQLVVTMVRVERAALRRLVSQAEELGVKMRVVPGLHEILDGRVNVSRLREVSIEDLLGRPPVALRADALTGFLAARIVLVTGAGGSIGAELATQIARFRPERLLLVERSEPALFAAHRQLEKSFPALEIEPIVGDVGDEDRMRTVLREHRPHVVLHAAAHKHVPLMELHPGEAVRNNTLASHALARLCGEHGVESFVLISSDKAVRPTSVMGASKRLAELLIEDLQRRFATRYVTVRFGNVMGSTGSVIPIFREQIAAGGPVTVTHAAMVRYFMTIQEAAQLVLQAAAMGRGGEVFVLDMGEPVRILDMAKEMIRLSGLEPGTDIEIQIIGLRPGEKLCEELRNEDEVIQPTRHPRIHLCRLSSLTPDTIARALPRLAELARRHEPWVLRQYLGELLPEARLGGAPAPPDLTRSLAVG